MEKAPRQNPSHHFGSFAPALNVPERRKSRKRRGAPPQAVPAPSSSPQAGCRLRACRRAMNNELRNGALAVICACLTAAARAGGGGTVPLCLPIDGSEARPFASRLIFVPPPLSQESHLPLGPAAPGPPAGRPSRRLQRARQGASHLHGLDGQSRHNFSKCNSCRFRCVGCAPLRGVAH